MIEIKSWKDAEPFADTEWKLVFFTRPCDAMKPGHLYELVDADGRHLESIPLGSRNDKRAIRLAKQIIANAFFGLAD